MNSNENILRITIWDTVANKILLHLKMCDYHDIRYRNIKNQVQFILRKSTSTNFLQNIQVCYAVSHIV